MVRSVTFRAGLVIAVTLFALATAIASFVVGIVLRVDMGGLQTNIVGDPEKKFMDECMRDFENLNSEDTAYRSALTKCIQKLSEDESLKRLPNMRLTVDDRVCDPVDLCSSGDPGQCLDDGKPRTAGYVPGDVMKCYQLIDNAKAEQDAFKKAELLERVAAECTDRARWKHHSNEVKLAYCFWKHLQFGVCTNIMRTNCPDDSSCCPIAQNDPSLPISSPARRPDQYVCRKSPIVGLFCQHIDFRVPVENISLQKEREFCTLVTCPSFGWCRDFADIPGECLGEACKDYRRATEFLIVCIICAGLGLAFDFVDLVILLRYPLLPKLKSTSNTVSACLKLLSYLLCKAAGAQETCWLARC